MIVSTSTAASTPTTDQKVHARELIVSNQNGIHARPASMIVRLTNKYAAEVTAEKDGELVNSKSIMGLMLLAAGRGSKVTFRVKDVPDEVAEELLNRLEDLFVRKFDEA